MTIIEWLRDKNSTENKDNILAPCMDAQTAVNFLIDYLIGDDWYVAYPACTEQVNTEAVMFILQKFSRKYKKELKAWNRRCGGVSFGKLAKEYGVCKKTIQDAVSGKHWSYLPQPPKGGNMQ